MDQKSYELIREAARTWAAGDIHVPPELCDTMFAVLEWQKRCGIIVDDLYRSCRVSEFTEAQLVELFTDYIGRWCKARAAKAGPTELPNGYPQKPRNKKRS